MLGQWRALSPLELPPGSSGLRGSNFIRSDLEQTTSSEQPIRQSPGGRMSYSSPLLIYLPGA